MSNLLEHQFLATRKQLEEIGLPGCDDYSLMSSSLTFPQGNHFGLEVATINTAKIAKDLLLKCSKRGIRLNRITETRGIMRHTKFELQEYIKICKDYDVEVVFSVGPRAPYDTSASSRTEAGKVIGYRLRGQEQVVCAIEDIKRAIELGANNFVVYDEGLLSVLTKFRKHGFLPANVKFKVSAHCACANPAAFRLLESIGADSINAYRDLSLPAISAIRKAVKIPIDIHIDNPQASGGFIRTYEAPTIVRIASPVYLKTGGGNISSHGTIISSAETDLIIDQLEITLEMLQNQCPELSQLSFGSSKNLNQSIAGEDSDCSSLFN
jgi:hypothetical protein